MRALVPNETIGKCSQIHVHSVTSRTAVSISARVEIVFSGKAFTFAVFINYEEPYV
jgi:hypothetical protein